MGCVLLSALSFNANTQHQYVFIIYFCICMCIHINMITYGHPLPPRSTPRIWYARPRCKHAMLFSMLYMLDLFKFRPNSDQSLIGAKMKQTVFYLACAEADSVHCLTDVLVFWRLDSFLFARWVFDEADQAR